MADIETELSSPEDRRCVALIQGDVASLAELLSDDLLWTHSSARQDTKSSFLAALGEGAARYLEMDRSEEKGRVRGVVAVVTGAADMRAVVNGDKKVLRDRYLKVWTRETGRWRMFACSPGGRRPRRVLDPH
jgi:ketosteroid isomerase-like protein